MLSTEKLMTILGLGLAASSSVAGIVATQVYQPENREGDRISWGLGLGLSLIVPVGIAIILFVLYQSRRKPRN